MPENNQIPKKEMLLLPDRDKKLQNYLVAFMDSNPDASFDDVRVYAKATGIFKIRLEVLNAMLGFFVNQLVKADQQAFTVLEDAQTASYINKSMSGYVDMLSQQVQQRDQELTGKISD